MMIFTPTKILVLRYSGGQGLPGTPLEVERSASPEQNHQSLADSDLGFTKSIILRRTIRHSFGVCNDYCNGDIGRDCSSELIMMYFTSCSHYLGFMVKLSGLINQQFRLRRPAGYKTIISGGTFWGVWG